MCVAAILSVMRLYVFGVTIFTFAFASGTFAFAYDLQNHLQFH